MSFSILSLGSRSGRSGGGLKKKRGLDDVGDSATLTTFLSKMASAADSHNVVRLQNDDKRPFLSQPYDLRAVKHKCKSVHIMEPAIQ